MHKNRKTARLEQKEREKCRKRERKQLYFSEVFSALSHTPQLPHSHYPEYERTIGEKIGLSVLCWMVKMSAGLSY
jgi:hypothetical protein